MLRLLGLAAVGVAGVSAAASPTFEVANNSFLLNGKEFHIRSGSLHYWRVPEAYWADRLKRMKAMGLNTVQTYIPWSLWEEEQAARQQGEMTDREKMHIRFLKVVQSPEISMWVVARPGPYACAEIDYGGLPARLVGLPELRTYDEGNSTAAAVRKEDGTGRPLARPANYIGEVKKFWPKVLGEIKPFLYLNGGRILMVQIENEYGSYGDTSKNPKDLKYVAYLRDSAFEVLGKAVQLFTTDPPYVSTKGGIGDGSEVLHIVDFGPNWLNVTEAFLPEKQLNVKGKYVQFNSEFYPGWFTAWGDDHFGKSDGKPIITDLEQLPSFNFYMVHGGTNFGFSSGANHQLASVSGGGGHGGISPPEIEGNPELYNPEITSYDYNSPIGEDGRHGVGSDGVDKFVTIRESLQKRLNASNPWNESIPEDPDLPTIGAYGTIRRSDRGVGLRESVRDAARDERCKVLKGGLRETRKPGAGLSVRKSFRIHFDEEGVYDAMVLLRWEARKGFEEENTAKSVSFNVTGIKDRVYVYEPRFKSQKPLYSLNRVGLVGETKSVHEVTIPIGRRGEESEDEGRRYPLFVDFLHESVGRENFSRDMPKEFRGFEFSVGDTSDRANNREGAIAEKFVRGGEWYVCSGVVPGSVMNPHENYKKMKPYMVMGEKDEKEGSETQVAAPEEEAEQYRRHVSSPFFYRFHMFISNHEDTMDTHIDLSDKKIWGKGTIIVNGRHNLGRYWTSQGPQYSLYVPGPFLKRGRNTFMVLEQENPYVHGAQLKFMKNPSYMAPLNQTVVQVAEEQQEMEVVI